MNKKSVAVLLAVLLVVGIVIGGTMAWLTSTPDPVRNVFTTGDVKLDLTETDTIDDADGNKTKDFQMIPGWTIEKDPKVTVQAISEACYVFVKAEKSSNFDEYMTYEIADGWSVLDATVYPGVYYKEIDAITATDTTYDVIKNNTVNVKDAVTKKMMNDLKTRSDYPTLTFKAYAIQLYKNNTEKFSATEAWQNVSTQSNA